MDPYLGLKDPDADPEGPKHTKPTDPDPQHLLQETSPFSPKIERYYYPSLL
jgi:hypothetical protein